MPDAQEVLVEYHYRYSNFEYWLDIMVDRIVYAEVGPFDTPNERTKAKTIMENILRKKGARDVANA